MTAPHVKGGDKAPVPRHVQQLVSAVLVEGHRPHAAPSRRAHLPPVLVRAPVQQNDLPRIRPNRNCLLESAAFPPAALDQLQAGRLGVRARGVGPPAVHPPHFVHTPTAPSPHNAGNFHCHALCNVEVVQERAAAGKQYAASPLGPECASNWQIRKVNSVDFFWVFVMTIAVAAPSEARHIFNEAREQRACKNSFEWVVSSVVGCSHV